MQALDQLVSYFPLGAATTAVVDPSTGEMAHQLPAEGVPVRDASSRGKRITNHDCGRHFDASSARLISITEFVRGENFSSVLTEARKISEIREVTVGAIILIAEIRCKP